MPSCLLICGRVDQLAGNVSTDGLLSLHLDHLNLKVGYLFYHGPQLSCRIVVLWHPKAARRAGSGTSHWSATSVMSFSL